MIVEDAELMFPGQDLQQCSSSMQGCSSAVIICVFCKSPPLPHDPAPPCWQQLVRRPKSDRCCLMIEALPHSLHMLNVFPAF